MVQHVLAHAPSLGGVDAKVLWAMENMDRVSGGCWLWQCVSGRLRWKAGSHKTLTGSWRPLHNPPVLPPLPLCCEP